MKVVIATGVSANKFVETDGQRAPPSAYPAPGKRLALRLRPEQLHLFDFAGLACRRTVELPT